MNLRYTLVVESDKSDDLEFNLKALTTHNFRGQIGFNDDQKFKIFSLSK